MAPTLLFDLSAIDLDQVVFDVAAIEKINPHRGHMRLLDAVVWKNDQELQMLGYHDVRHDEFWIEGHFPDRPLFPGVLMVEAGAQLASINYLIRHDELDFMGFAGINDVRFRGQVKPGDRLYLLAKMTENRNRRSISLLQGVVDGTLVFEGTIKGMPF